MATFSSLSGPLSPVRCHLIRPFIGLEMEKCPFQWTQDPNCRVVKQQNNEGELSSLCGTNLLFFNFLPQGLKLCPLGVLLNPVVMHLPVS